MLASSDVTAVFIVQTQLGEQGPRLVVLQAYALMLTKQKAKIEESLKVCSEPLKSSCSKLITHY